MTDTFLRQPVFFILVMLAVLKLACAPAQEADTEAAAEATASAEAPAPVDRDVDDGVDRGSVPAFLEQEDEVAMNALSTETWTAQPASACDLPDLEAEGGALVYFGCTPATGPVVRAVPARRAVETASDREAARTAALEALLAGPTTEEQAAGFLSSFGPETASVDFRIGDRDGTTWVDFDRSLLDVEGLFVAPLDAAQIVATLGQFEDTERVLILIGGEPVCRAKGDC